MGVGRLLPVVFRCDGCGLYIFNALACRSTAPVAKPSPGLGPRDDLPADLRNLLTVHLVRQPRWLAGRTAQRSLGRWGRRFLFEGLWLAPNQCGIDRVLRIVGLATRPALDCKDANDLLCVDVLGRCQLHRWHIAADQKRASSICSCGVASDGHAGISLPLLCRL